MFILFIGGPLFELDSSSNGELEHIRNHEYLCVSWGGKRNQISAIHHIVTKFIYPYSCWGQNFESTVAIGKPERQACKASHCGSKQH